MEKFLAGYIRVSTEMQAERDSLIHQEETISSFSRLKNKDLRIYRDARISAKDKDRPAFQEMLKDVRQGLIEAVVVTKLDRITRSLKDLIFLKEFFEEHAVSFISITQNLDTSTPMGRFSFYILGLVAELEREMTAERVAEDMKGRARRRKWNGGVVPYGFTSQSRYYREYLKKKAEEMAEGPDEGRFNEILHALERDPKTRQEALAFASRLMPEPKILAVDPRQAETVKAIFQLYLKHKSFRGVVHTLNSMGVKTREGQPWASTSIHRILQNPIYYGALTYNKRKTFGRTSRPRPKDEHILVEGAFDPIISKEQFLEVQGIIESQNRVPPSSKSSPYLLTGLMECQLCGAKMYGYTYNDPRKNRVYRYYRCNGHISKGSAICPGNTVDSDTVERIILEELKNISTEPETLKAKAQGFEIRFGQEIKPLLEKQKALQQSLSKLGRKSQRVLGLYDDEMIEKEEFIKERASLNSEREFLESELQEVNQRVFSSDLGNFDLRNILSSIHNLAEAFDELDFPERKELLRTVINKIEIGKHHLDCQIFALPKSFVDYGRMDRDSWPRRA